MSVVADGAAPAKLELNYWSVIRGPNELAPPVVKAEILGEIEYQHVDDSFGSERDWERVEAGFRTAIPLGKNLMWISVAAM